MCNSSLYFEFFSTKWDHSQFQSKKVSFLIIVQLKKALKFRSRCNWNKCKKIYRQIFHTISVSIEWIIVKFKDFVRIGPYQCQENASLVCNRRDQVKQAVGLCRESLFLVFFYQKRAAIWHFLSKSEVFVFTASIGESECDAEGGASNFFAKFLFGKLSLHYLFERIHRCLLQPLHAWREVWDKVRIEFD